MPRRRACFASAMTPARPFVVGTESRTIVQPLRPAGHAASRFAGGAVGAAPGAVSVVVGAPVVVGAVVGSGAAVVVSRTLEAAGEVATSVSVAELERSVSQRAETTPATAATTSARRAGQIQSP